MQEILRVENLRYHYRKDQAALKDVSLSFYKGEKIALIGNNGAGKSTLFFCCNGVLRTEKGKIYLKGKRLTENRHDIVRQRQCVGLVFQDADSQMIGATIEKEISFGPMNLGFSKEEVGIRLEKVLKQLRLEELRKRAPHEISGGEKKRVSIADILVMEAELILMDEPAAGLDPKHRRLLEELLNELAEEGIGLVVATHDLDFAWRWAQRIIVMKDGRVVADGTPEDIFTDKNLLNDCDLDCPQLVAVGEIFHINPLPKRMEDIQREYL